MQMTDIFLVLFSLGSGGKTNATFRLATTLAQAGLNTNILTVGFHRNYEELVAGAYDEGVPRSVMFLNPYVEFENRHTEDGAASWSLSEDANELGMVRQNDRFEEEHYVRYFDQHGEYLKFRRWDAKGDPIRTTYFSARRVRARREYNHARYCNLEIHYDLATGNPVQECYMTRDGFCYLSRWLDAESGNLQGVFVNDRSTLKSRRYNNDVGWHVDWLRDKIAEVERPPVVIANSSGIARRLLRVSPKAAYRIFVWHENHFARPFTFGSEIRADYADIFAKFDQMECVVVATASQAADLQRQFNRSDINVIPPFAADVDVASKPAKQPGKVGVFTRLVPGKQVDQLIAIASKIKAAHPDFTLHIYGRGECMNDLKHQAIMADVMPYVRFHGRVSNAMEEMATCQITVSTSEVESFGLSIAESLAVGTPVIAYDINYGPSDLIHDGINGWLISLNDTTSLATRITKALSDPERLERMGREAAQRAKADLTAERYRTAWLRLVQAGTANIQLEGGGDRRS